jgi:hypothetical protein
MLKRSVSKFAQKYPAHSPALELFGHRKCHLRHILFHQQKIFPDGNDTVKTGLTDYSDQGQVLDIIYLGYGLNIGSSEAALGMKEPLHDIFLVQVVIVFPDLPRIQGLGRTYGDHWPSIVTISSRLTG